MSVSQMKKLSVIALRNDADKLMRRLMWLSCVELSCADHAADGLSPCEGAGEERAVLERRCSRISEAITLLDSYDKSKKSLFPQRQQLTQDSFDLPGDDSAAAETAAGQALRIEELRSETLTSLNRARQKIAQLSPWRACDIPLDESGTRHTNVVFGTLPAETDAAALSEKLSGHADNFAVETVSSDKTANYIYIIYHIDEEYELTQALSRAGFAPLDFSEYHGNANDCIAALESECETCAAQIAELENELTELANTLPAIKRAYDIARTALVAVAAKEKLGCTSETVILSGWVPLRSLDTVSMELERLGCCYGFEDPEEGDDVPSMLINNAYARPFEYVVGMYSFPKYRSFDPTFIMSLFYFVIFGFMLADVGYGLMLSLGCFAAIKLMRPKGGMRQLLSLFSICGVACIIAGVLFGSYLGDLPQSIMTNILGMENPPELALLFNPVDEPMSFLILSLVIGVLHLFCGMGIKFYVLCKNGHPLDAVFDIGSWFLLFAGIGMIFIVPIAGKLMAAAGVLMLIATQGRSEKNIFMRVGKSIFSLYDIVNYISDLLSYSRIMALGLASAVIASVVNIFGTMGGFIGIIIAVLFGHVLNLAINLLGSFVHTSRLQYIEFFGKFYEDGGREFKPMTAETKYTDIILDEKTSI